jgi:hypothetical protein
MKIVLQNRSNLSYVENSDGGWTKDGEGALEFASSLDALLFCFDQDMVDMQMVARFVDPALNFCMSVTDARTVTSRSRGSERERP